MSQNQTLRKRVYFKLNAPEASEVALCGSFNNWDTQARKLRKSKRGIWSTSMTLEEGTYEYRYFVDGEWCNSPEADQVPNAYGATNSIVVVQ